MRILVIPILFLALFFMPLYYAAAAPSSNQKEYRVNDEFTDMKLKLKPNTYVLDCKREDINNDNIIDNIMLIGYKKDGVQSHFSVDIEIMVQDGKNKKYNRLQVGEVRSGFGGRLFVGDFNGDNFPEALTILNTGTYGEIPLYSLTSLFKDTAKPLFNQKSFSMGLNFDITFVDKFRVSIFNKELSKFFTLDVRNKRYSYVECDIYDKSGEVKRIVKGQCSGYEELTPIDIDKDGVYELKGIQRIVGFSNNDTIGYIKSIWKFKGKEMKLQLLEVIPYSKAGSTKKVQRIIPVYTEIT